MGVTLTVLEPGRAKLTTDFYYCQVHAGSMEYIVT